MRKIYQIVFEYTIKDPKTGRNIDTVHNVRALLIISAITSFIYFSYSCFYYFVIESNVLGISHFSCGVFSILSIFLYRYTKNYVFILNILFFLAASAIYLGVIYSGGIISPNMYWLIVASMVGQMFLGKNNSSFWIGTYIFLTILLGIWEYSDIPRPDNIYTDDFFKIYQVITAFSVLVVGAFFTYIFRKMIDDAFVEIVNKSNEIKKLNDVLHSSNEDLEKRVEQRTEEINTQKIELENAVYKLKLFSGSINSMINSLDEGFIVFDEKGKCDNTYSQTCIKLLEQNPSGKFIHEILKVTDELEIENINMWLDLIFSNQLEFEDAAILGPTSYQHSNLEKSITLSYRPIYDDKKEKIIAIVMIVSDKSKELQAIKKEEKIKEDAERIVRIANNKSLVAKYLSEINNTTNKINAIIEKKDVIKINEIQYILHTLKGGASSFLFSDLVSHIHNFEDVLMDRKKDEVIRIDELIAIKNLFLEWKKRFLENHSSILGKDFEEDETYKHMPMSVINNFLNNVLEHGDEYIRKAFLETFVMTPIQEMFQPFELTLKEMSSRLGKKIKQIKYDGPSLKIYSPIYENVFNSFVHIFKNIVEHGIENPSMRNKLGKDEFGEIDVSWKIQDDSLIIRIKDDGRGVDVQKVKDKMEGISELNRPDHEIIQEIFSHQFTSTYNVSVFSGRGVGLSAVKSEVEKLNGKIWVESLANEGAEFVIKLPYTQLIIDLFSQDKKVLSVF